MLKWMGNFDVWNFNEKERRDFDIEDRNFLPAYSIPYS